MGASLSPHSHPAGCHPAGIGAAAESDQPADGHTPPRPLGVAMRTAADHPRPGVHRLTTTRAVWRACRPSARRRHRVRTGYWVRRRSIGAALPCGGRGWEGWLCRSGAVFL